MVRCWFGIQRRQCGHILSIPHIEVPAIHRETNEQYTPSESTDSRLDNLKGKRPFRTPTPLIDR